MESSLIKARRKKRKTRKYLDEMRKKSRMSFTNNNIINLSKRNKEAENNIVTGKTRRESIVTANLLRFNMFTKTVCSETITRPIFSNLKQCDLETNKMEPVVSPNVKTRKLCNVIACHETDQFSKEVSNYLNMKNSEDNSSDSLILFSPLLHRRSSTCNFNISAKDEATITSFTATPNRSDENYDGYYLYEELMNDIPTYIRRNFTNLIKEDIIRKTRKCLQVLCAKSSYQEQKSTYTFKNNSLDDVDGILSTNKEAIVHNPMDYIRLGWLKCGHIKHRESTNYVSCSTPDTSYSPFKESQNVLSLQSCTPDYDFFPHKLNE